MNGIQIIFVLSVIGIIETIYLIKKRLSFKTPVCIFGTDCKTVLWSKYNRLFIIPNDILGMLTYILIAGVALAINLKIGSFDFLNFVLKITVAVASLISVFLTYLQWKIIKQWCSWCLISAITVWIMLFILIF